MIKTSKRLFKLLLAIAGTLSLALGLIGIFVPLLPTTPFLLLSAACYVRSSRKAYDWLLNNRLFGNYIRNYRSKKGIPLRIKVLALAVLWTTIITSAVFFVRSIWVRLLLLLMAVLVTRHIVSIRTLKKQR